MSIEQVILGLLASYAVCFGLVNDKAALITNPLKKLPLFRAEDGENTFGRMLRCPYCTGFHAGWITYLVVSAPVLLGEGDLDALSLVSEGIVFAFASCAFCYIADVTAQWLEETASS